MSYGENKRFDNLKLPVTWAVLAIVAVICVVAAILLLGDRREGLGEKDSGLRQVFDSVTKAPSSALSTPAQVVGEGGSFIDEYFFAVRENRELRKKVAELEQYRDQYHQAKDLNQRYEKLLNLRIEPEVETVAARSVSVTRGPFNRNRLINVGSQQGVAFGHPVMTEHGLIGRVVSVGPQVSRVMMVTDVVSHVPVMIMRSDARAIMNGDGGPYPKLDFIRGRDAIQEGDQIYSSGDGGIFPRGLPVGIARKGVDGWRVQLYANRSPIDFVKVLKYEDFTRLPDADSVMTSPDMTSVLPPPQAGAAVNSSASAAASTSSAVSAARPTSTPQTNATTSQSASARPAAAGATASRTTPPAASRPATPSPQPSAQPSPQPSTESNLRPYVPPAQTATPAPDADQ